MSQTPSLGVVGPSHWAYTAAVMADHLDLVLGRGSTQPTGLPVRVHHTAKEFFRLALEATRNTPPENPPASLANYRLATDTVVQMVQPKPSTSSEVDLLLNRYADFVAALATARSIGQPERQLAQELRDFFLELARAGADEDYANAVRFETYERASDPDSLR